MEVLTGFAEEEVEELVWGVEVASLLGFCTVDVYEELVIGNLTIS